MLKYAQGLVLCALAGCGGDLSFSGYSMASRYTVKGRGCQTEKSAIEQVEHAFYSVDSSMSNWSEESEVSRFNRLNPGESMEISESMIHVIAESQRVHKQTDGLFDPSIGELIESWGFGVRTRSSLPDLQEVETARRNSGMDGFRLNRNVLTRTRAIRLNLSGIAKGYAVDQVSQVVSRHCQEYFVEAGGELRVKGAWEIGIQHPGKEGLIVRMQLKDLAAATSGTYANRRESQGKRVSHIIDPRSGYPGQAAVSVTVVGESCETADALATALVLAEETHMNRILQRFPGYGAVAVFEAEGGYQIRTAGKTPAVQCENPAAAATERATAAASGTTTLLPNCL